MAASTGEAGTQLSGGTPFALLDVLLLESGERWGDVATDEQRRDALAVLDVTATPYHWLGRARGWSKTSDLAGILLEVLLNAPPGSRSYAFGADRDQAGLLVDALAGFIHRGGRPLANLLDVQAWRISMRSSGASLEAMAADEHGAWGLRPYFVVVDELGQWPTTRGARRLWEAVASAVPKTAGRLVVATTASDPAHWSARLRVHALEDPLWRVSEVHGPPPWMSGELVEEQRRRLPDSSFRRLFLNEWVSGEDRLVAEEDLAACVTLDGPQDPQPGHRYVIGVDVGLKHDRTVAAICHLDSGVVTLDRMGVWQGSRLRPVRLGEVEEWLERAGREYRAQIIVDPWQAAQLVERLGRRGLRIAEYPFSAQSVGRIASTLFLLLRERSLRLPEDEELLDELRNVRLRDSGPGVLRLDHDSGRHDDRAIALALAAHRLIERGEHGVLNLPGRGVPRARVPVAGAWASSTPAGRAAASYAAARGAGRDPLVEKLAQLGVDVAGNSEPWAAR